MSCQAPARTNAFADSRKKTLVLGRQVSETAHRLFEKRFAAHCTLMMMTTEMKAVMMAWGVPSQVLFFYRA